MSINGAVGLLGSNVLASAPSPLPVEIMPSGLCEEV
jgi:hypothetical protein